MKHRYNRPASARSAPSTDRPVGRDRRRFLRAAGALATAGVVAGCSGDTSGEEVSADALSEEDRQRIDAWLQDAGNYDGSFAEPERGPPYEALVDVGAQGNGGHLAFDPPAWVIPTGETVVWQWTGRGGSHNVVSAGDSDVQFRSGDPKTSGKYERTFDTAGVALYYCKPHRSAGMKGAIAVL